MAIVYVSDNKILVGVSALIVSGMLISSFIKIRKNKNIDNKTKRSSYYSLLVLVSVLIVTIMKIISK
jgi:heme/copper-type cytochrome/quinol oxidase subunit 2